LQFEQASDHDDPDADSSHSSVESNIWLPHFDLHDPAPSQSICPSVPHGVPLGLFSEPHMPPLQVGVTQSFFGLQSVGAKHATHFPFASHLLVPPHGEPAALGVSPQALPSHIGTEHSPLALQATIVMD
jgi:hypothetical protein